MLYDWWKELAERKSAAFAVRDESGRDWTFGELDRAAAGVESPALAFPRGLSIKFIVETLAAWRAGAITCPLEPGQAEPVVKVEELPRGCAHLKLTSATSGAPKLIAFTAEQLRADWLNIGSTMGLREEWPNVAAISLAHSYGFSNLVLPLVLGGIPLVILGTPLPEQVRAAVERLESATVPAVPALWRAWLEAGVLSGKVRLAISAGAPLPLELEQEVFTRTQIKVHNFYGSSECGGIAYDGTSEPREVRTLAGRALENVQLQLSEQGTLRVRSEAVAIGYVPVGQAGLGEGEFTTTDLVEFRADGVHLLGRTGEAINVAGRKVAPEQIEAVLRQNPAVIECVVFGVPSIDAKRGEDIVASISVREPLSEVEVRTFLSEHLPGWQIPRVISFEKDLRVNARGKISRAEWRQRFLERQR